MIADSELKELAAAVIDSPDAEVGELYDRLVATLNTEPDDIKARFLFAAICNRAKHYGVARAIMEPMIRTHGQWGALRINYGMSLDYTGDLLGAINQYRLAEQDKTVDKTNLFSNRASALIKLGRYEEADADADRALALNPRSKEAAINKGFSRLAMGDLGQGWDYFNVALGGKYRLDNDYGVPRWKGEEGARLIVHGEQGLGDEIMYASCIPDLAGRCSALAIDADPKLSKLFRRSFPEAQVYGTRNAKTRTWVDGFQPTHSIAIGSLPGLYRREQSDFPRTSYLSADSALRDMYRTLFESSNLDCPSEVIGLCWTGGGPDTKEKLREIPLKAFAPLVEKYPHAAFVSLQYREDAQAQIEDSGLPIQHHQFATGRGASYEHTAAAVAACDRVVGTDTTVIHAAGAMGVRTDCLLSTPAMWVHSPWHHDKSPWYGSVKLHRTPPSFDWTRQLNHLVSQGLL